MITIRFAQEIASPLLMNRHNSVIYELHIEGHAGYDDGGKDIVCAGVSALAHGYAFCIKHMLDERYVVQMVLDPGNTHIQFYVGEWERRDHMKLTVEAFKEAFLSLQTAYPDNVKVIGA